ncbi:MAG TPA: KEOPS complex subunit Pcc1 [Methanomassiliicoccales archaeon]|nr:KEOPS complex subunit Pcc1 [Methanomassiliicoccales archaeon]
MPSAVLSLTGPGASTVFGAISPEAGREIPRTKVQADLEGDRMVLRIEARDLPALRAALNSYLRWIKIAEDMNRMAGA